MLRYVSHRSLITGVSLLLLGLTLANGWRAVRAEQKSSPVKSSGVKLPDITLPRAEGGQSSLTALAGDKGLVLVFLSTDCPIANGYVPTLTKLAAELKPRGVRIAALNPNAGQSLKQMQQHQQEFEFAFPYLRDAGGVVASKLEVQVCPTACLFDAAGNLVYAGRIDDRYMKRGGAAVDVQTHDLANAVEAMLAGKPIAEARTKVLGCGIQFAKTSASDREPISDKQVTYASHVAALLNKHCVECHHPGGIGPFSLQTYDEAARWADDIVAFTADGSMPPWKLENKPGLFAHDRRLNQADIELLAQWAKTGNAAGDLSQLPAPRKFTSSWRLGEPDVVLSADTDYQLAADGDDVYRCFVLPTNFQTDKFVTAMEVIPGNAAVVHHVIAFLDTGDSSQELDAKDPGAGYSTTAGFPGFLPAGGLGGWAPGNTDDFLPAGMAKVLPKGAKIVMQVHYHKSGKSETDRTKLGLYFSKVPVNRAVNSIPVLSRRGPAGLRIPAGDAHYEARGAIVLPSDQLVLGVTPHMHLLGKEMQVTATYPDGKQQNLLALKDWDFNWQESYTYEEPLLLPRGTRLELVAHFDNSAANRRNPNKPPQLVTWGEGTNDEMCIAFFEAATTVPAKSERDVHAMSGVERLRFMLEARRLAGESPEEELRNHPLVKGIRERFQGSELPGWLQGKKE